MSITNVIQRFEREMAAARAAVEARGDTVRAKIEAQNARLEAQNAMIDAQNAKLTWMQWMLGIGFVVLAVMISIFGPLL